MLGPGAADGDGRKRKWEDGGGDGKDGIKDDWRERERFVDQNANFVQDAPQPATTPKAGGPAMHPHGGPDMFSGGGGGPMGPPSGMPQQMQQMPSSMGPPMGSQMGMGQPMMQQMMPMSMVPNNIPPPRTGPGLRLGEGDDRGRSRDEIRIIKEMLAEEINQFIVVNRVDGPAARDLRVEPVHVQLAVLDRGPLTSCVNPSGALIGRIRDAKKSVRAAGGMPAQIHQSIQLPPGQGVPAQPMPAGPAPGMGGGMGGMGGIGGPLATPMPSVGGPELERFIMENRLDQGAATSLRQEAKEVQDKVIAMGPLVNAINPSAALMGRIRNVRQGVMNYQGGHAHMAAAAAAAVSPMPPMGSLPPGPVMSHASPPALQDRAMNDEAMKAIRGLQEMAARAPESQGQANAPAQAQPQNLTIEDSQLQAEALKAIQAINMSDL